LKSHEHLVIDTRFFGTQFKDRLLATGASIDSETDGVLVHSENFQALQLLKYRSRAQVHSVYIDPPYNSDAGPISYKNGYAPA